MWLLSLSKVSLMLQVYLMKPYFKIFVILTAGILIVLVGCKKSDDQITPDPNLPKVITHPFSDLTPYSVKLSGAVTAQGASAVSESGFLLDTIPLPTIERNANKFVRDRNANGEMSLTITNISGNHTIYIRSYAVNAHGTGYGNEVSFKSLPEKSFPGMMKLSTQDEVIDVGKSHFTHIGQLEITGSVTDLSPLQDLASIGGALYIRNTTNLMSLKGLDNLEAANATGLFHGMYIENNAKLQTLKGLDKMAAARGELYIRDNDELESLDGLGSLTYIHFGDFMIEGCAKLRSLRGLEKFTWLNGDLILINNPVLNDIRALGNLSTLTDVLKIFGNPTLQNLDGLESLRKVESLYLEDLPLLSDLNGLSNLDSITGGLSITNLRTLKSLVSFSKTSHIGYMTISECPSMETLAEGAIFKSVGGATFRSTGLTTLNGLQNMTSARTIEIYNNAKLTDLRGLNGLESMRGESYSLLIHTNKNLTSLAGLENLKRGESPSNTGSVQLIDNSVLANYCGLKPLLASNWPGFFYVAGNLANPERSEIVNKCDK
jgi:hypothetical protein